MRLNRLAANLVTLRGANSQADAAVKSRGADSGGIGGEVTWYAKEETAFGAGMHQIKKRPSNIAELKRLVRKYGGNIRGWAGVLGTFSR